MLMTSINTASLQQFSSQFHRYSSNSISDEYKKNLYLARIAREDRRASTQNSVGNAVETIQEEQHVSNISDEVTVSQPSEYSTPKPSVNTPAPQTNSSEKSQTYDNNINQLKARKNSLQQKLNRLNQKGTNQATSSNQEGERGTTQDVEATTSPTRRLTTEEAPLTNVLKRQIVEIEQELNKNSDISAIGENFNSTNGLSLSQLRQKKTRLEQQLRNLGNVTSRPHIVAQETNHTTTRVTVEEQKNSQYQNRLEEMRTKQEIRNLENKINTLERKQIVNKTQAALNEMRNASNETTTENHLLSSAVKSLPQTSPSNNFGLFRGGLL